MPSTLTIVPWPDPVLDRVGHDPRSRYVETFWLPSLGPTAVLLLRHLASRFDTDPDGVELTIATASHALGLGRRDGTSSPLVRTLERLGRFNLTCDEGNGTMAVRRKLPPINPRHVRRLPAHLRDEHARWAERGREGDPLEVARGRARTLALALAQQGEDAGRIEQVLAATGFHPSIAAESTRWALRRARQRATSTEAPSQTGAGSARGRP